MQNCVRRYAEAAWGLRDDLLEAVTGAVNGYRQLQIFQLVQTLFAQHAAADTDVAEVLAFTRTLRAAMLEAVHGACTDDERLTAPQVKELSTRVSPPKYLLADELGAGLVEGLLSDFSRS